MPYRDLEKRRRYLREYRRGLHARRKSNGLCKDCERPLDTKGVRCISCSDKHKANHRTRRIRLKASGLCTECAGPNDTDGVLCEACSKEQHARAIKMRERRNSDGLCVTCGVPWEYSKCCPNCIDRNTRDAMIRRMMKV